MRILDFTFRINLDDLPAEERKKICDMAEVTPEELDGAGDIDIKELGVMVAHEIANAETAEVNEFWAGSDMFGRFAGVKLIGARDIGMPASNPRSAWGVGEAHREILDCLKNLRQAMKHGNGLAAWHAMEDRADRAIALAEAANAQG